MATWKPVVEEQFANLRKLSAQLATRAEYLEATNQNAEARWLRSYQRIVDEIADELTKAVAEDRNRLVRLWKSVPGVARGAGIVVGTTVLTLGTTSAYGTTFDGDAVQQCVEVIVQFESDNTAAVEAAVPTATVITATGGVVETRSGTAQITANDLSAKGSGAGVTVHTGTASGAAPVADPRSSTPPANST